MTPMRPSTAFFWFSLSSPVSPSPSACMRAIVLALLSVLPALAGAAAPAARPFTAKDLVMIARVSDPQLSPDGHSLAFTVRETEFEANGAERGIWKLDLRDARAKPQRLTAAGSNAWSPRWSPDGHLLYFLSNRSGSSQLWRLGEDLGEARPVTHLPLDIDNYRL